MTGPPQAQQWAADALDRGCGEACDTERWAARLAAHGGSLARDVAPPQTTLPAPCGTGTVFLTESG